MVRGVGGDAEHDPLASLRAGSMAAIVLSILAAAVLVTMAVPDGRRALEDLDERWLAWMVDARRPQLVWVSRALDVLGAGLVLWPVRLVVAAWLGWQRRTRALAVWVSATVGSEIALGLLKVAYQRTRPPGSLVATTGYSFPSGHTTAATVTAAALVIVLVAPGRDRRRWGIGAAGLAVLMGLSRTMLAAHWLSDAVAGAIVGLTVTLGASAVVQWRSSGRPGATGVPAEAAGRRGSPSSPG